MRQMIITAMLALVVSAPCGAVEFLGVELCKGSVDTSVVLPVGSPLSLESAEIGRHGGLLMLLTAPNTEVLDLIDDLMATYTGTRGSGSEEKLQWSGNEITAYAQIIKKGYAALAVSTTDDCRAAEPAPDAETAAEEPAAPDATAPTIDETQTATGAAVATGAAAGVAAAPAPVPPATPEPTQVDDFELKGRAQTRGRRGWLGRCHGRDSQLLGSCLQDGQLRSQPLRRGRRAHLRRRDLGERAEGRSEAGV